MKIGKRHKVSDELPGVGVLCVVTFPLSVQSLTGKVCGHSATAYYRKDNGGWIYADVPSKLRFEPYYWYRIVGFEK
ncbi:MAG: hypothetical protein KAV87_35840 [Desulfobacteraceae bacterium]|nr:hypothetical protein [Desulfobacteraceae bacterium]